MNDNIINSSKIIQHCGTAVDIARLKSMQVVRKGTAKHILVFQLNARTEYVFNPITNTWEKEMFNDVVKVVYDDFEMANEIFFEWAEIWHDFAENQQQ